ncbi:MAG TPA: hypothetical protein ENK33_02780 [Desulfobacterales bacterium]|nr:hypothetical protein [Desulfobacterales bacterium]
MGIVFLANLIKSTNNPKTAAYLKKRLLTLQKINYIEDKVKKFKKTRGRFPENIKELVAAGLLRDIPKDPYGGRSIILTNGRVYTTSNMIEQKQAQRVK